MNKRQRKKRHKNIMKIAEMVKDPNKNPFLYFSKNSYTHYGKYVPLPTYTEKET